MNLLKAVARWLDVRPEEYRTFSVSALGAFLLISFLVAGRALRESLFLERFGAASLPYIVMATAVAGLPAVILFSRVLGQHSPLRVYRWLLIALAGGLAALGVAATAAQGTATLGALIVSLYMWLALGTLLLTSSFWVVASEYFQLRDAKRLFGMISGGGTLGAMVTGASLGILTEWLSTLGLVSILIMMLVALLVLQSLLPREPAPSAALASPTVSMREGFVSIVNEPHLRTIALIVATATMATTMVDFQFKEMLDARFASSEEFARYFGLFYGVTGVISLLIQVLLASRLLASTGVAWTLAVLPIVLLLGSTAFLLAPGLLSVTLLRGADTSLRKSLHRSVIEYLFVPLPSALRRKTKAFIDTTVDTVAEGTAALMIYLVVTLAGLSSQLLSLFVLALAGAFLFLSRAMGLRYFETLVLRLQEGQNQLDDATVGRAFTGGETMMTMSVTQVDMQTLLSQSGIVPVPPESTGGAGAGTGATTGARAGQRDEAQSTLARITSPDPRVVSTALDEARDWNPTHVEPLIRLLARDAFYKRAGGILGMLGEHAVGPLVDRLLDEGSDFVIRRRIPRVLAAIDVPSADAGLLDALLARRFEVRYRAGVAVARRRKKGRALASGSWQDKIWRAVREELGHERPIWELQRLLDDVPEADDFVSHRVYRRGELSLEHTFRLLSLVLEPEPVRTAFHGIVRDDEHLRSISLEYLEQVLPADVRQRLWPFIGDISDHQRSRSIRQMDDVVADLLKTGATLFGGEIERAKLREALGDGSDDDGDS